MEYVLLYAKDWAAFAMSDMRQQRLRQITRASQAVGILIGADAAIAITQQVRARV